MALSLLLLIAPLTACERISSSAVSPTLANYDAAFQLRAAEEMAKLRPACARDVVIEQCSTIKRMIIDYKELRDKVRAIEG